MRMTMSRDYETEDIVGRASHRERMVARRARKTTPNGQATPSFECEDCIGMKEHGCYCAAMGATKPGGPAKE